MPPHLKPLTSPSAFPAQERTGECSPTQRRLESIQSSGVQANYTRSIRTPSETTKQRALQEKALSRMTAKLPFELRESVTAVVKMA
ncbi:hypothetical protein EON64_17070, partial [archaeon]